MIAQSPLSFGSCDYASRTHFLVVDSQVKWRTCYFAASTPKQNARPPELPIAYSPGGTGSVGTILYDSSPYLAILTVISVSLAVLRAEAPMVPTLARTNWRWFLATTNGTRWTKSE